MARIKFNDNENYDFAINGYSRNTNFEGGIMSSYVYINFVPAAGLITKLQTLGISGITDFELTKDNGTSLLANNNITATISSIDESLNGEDININVNIRVS